MTTGKDSLICEKCGLVFRITDLGRTKEALLEVGTK